VILEAGSSDFSIDWAFVQPEVAKFVRVCSYDRSGSGWSDRGPYPHSISQTVFELNLPPFARLKVGGWFWQPQLGTRDEDEADCVEPQLQIDRPKNGGTCIC